MKNLEIKNVDCHATLAMIEKRWGFPRRTLRALPGMTKSGQSGRSMIEMLGVLAIIGVLSVGGIAGYSKAMQKYRINKTIEQITLIAGNVRAFFAPQKSYDGVDNNTILRKAKLIPDEMWNTSGGGFTNVFGLGTYINRTPVYPEDGNDYGFFIALDVPHDEEIFVELLTKDWSASNASYICAFVSQHYCFNLPVNIDTAVSAVTTMFTNYVDGDTDDITYYFDAEKAKDKLDLGDTPIWY